MSCFVNSGLSNEVLRVALLSGLQRSHEPHENHFADNNNDHVEIVSEKYGIKISNLDYKQINVKKYNPLVFDKIRKTLNVNLEQILQSMSQPLNSAGQLAHSGSTFFFSHDDQFLIKSLTHHEMQYLLRQLPKYEQHLARNPNSILCKFLGAYRVSEGADGQRQRKKIYLVLMSNVDPMSGIDDDQMVRVQRQKVNSYDIKAKDLLHGRDIRDYKKYLNDKPVINRDPARVNNLRLIVEEDVKFLISINVNDYSFLLDVYNDGYFYLAIIDILGDYSRLRDMGRYFIPAAYWYFPRFIEPRNYAQRMLLMFDELLKQN
ncbi:hypothetical protein MIR68_010654 [Amoeboaphelidium protococcarum]|nr:hypothetical protein MIR68_010654 [Amoeboaphelidium protococcarum]